MIKKRISELCLLDLTIDEFIRSVEKELVKLVPYKHEESTIHKAVGLAPFEISVASAGRPSEVIEQIEAGQTKRELAFALFDLVAGDKKEPDPQEMVEKMLERLKKNRN